MEMWIRIPLNGWATLISNEGQYRMTLDYDRITCWHDQVRAVSSGEIGTDTWVHVACTYDGTTLRAFVNGSSSGCTRLSQPISTLGTAGTMLVDNYYGAFDDIHIYARGLTETEICTRANKSDCSSSCGDW